MLYRTTEATTGSLEPRVAPDQNGSTVPLVRLGDGSEPPVAVAQTDIAMLRGVTGAAADVSPCMCPEPCERDHANE